MIANVKTDLSVDERQLLDDAREFQRMSRLPAWKKLLDALGTWADVSLGELRHNTVNKAYENVTSESVIVWREREAALAFVQNIVLGPVERRDNLVREILSQRGLTHEKIEEFITRYYDEGDLHA